MYIFENEILFWIRKLKLLKHFNNTNRKYRFDVLSTIICTRIKNLFFMATHPSRTLIMSQNEIYTILE